MNGQSHDESFGAIRTITRKLVKEYVFLVVLLALEMRKNGHLAPPFMSVPSRREVIILVFVSEGAKYSVGSCTN